MKRQFVRGASTLLLVMALALVTAVAANGQSHRSIANVPFEFVANNRTLPVGQYIVTNLSTAREVVKISNAKEAKGVFAMTIPLSRKGSSEKGKLVFRRYGNRYFLAEIWTGGEREGLKLMKSREEKAIENELAAISSKSELAQNGFERVEIALVRN